MRVLQVVTHMNRGGLETMLINHYRQLDRERVQFDFLVHRYERGDYDDELEAMGARIYRLPVLNPLSLSYRCALDRFFAEHPEYKLIHVHQDCMSALILKSAKRHGLRVRIAHSHSSTQDKNLKYPIKALYRHFIPKYATALFACSEASGQWMFCGAEFSVFNNAINSREYSFNPEKRSEMRAKLHIAEKELLVGHVGRFSPPKNHDFLLDIFRSINRKTPSKLLLVGDGELRAKIEQKIQRLGLEEAVILAGVRSDVADLLQAMDVFVFPSIHEGLPLALLEAQASGLPCLISDKLPIDCKQTELLAQLSLSAGAERWAKAAIKAAEDTLRRDSSAEIKASGFDIVDSARRLQDFYLSCGEV